MSPIPKGGTVAVTGSTGYIGGWVVRRLLEENYRVRACVRDPNDPVKVAFLKDMPGYLSGRLTLHGADLDQDGCFDDVFRGCHGVCHLSHVSDYTDQDYVRRVCEHVVASVEQSDSVSRVIVTSSIAAVISEVDMQEVVRRPVFYEGRFPDETNPKRTPQRGQAYSMGKVIAERAFADAARSSGRWDAITVCPGDNIGPILAAHQKNGAWQHIIEGMLSDAYEQTGAYRPWMTVDVRDAADCHVALLGNVDVSNGERYLAWSTDTRDVEDICASIDRLLPELGHDAPAMTNPFPDRIKIREHELRAIWAGCDLRNDRIRAVTGIKFRAIDESIRDCVESLLSVGSVQPRLRPGFNLPA